MPGSTRAYRTFRELELNPRVNPKKRIVRAQPEPLALPEAINLAWLMFHVRLARRFTQFAVTERAQ